MDLRGRRANIHVQFSKMIERKNISILLLKEKKGGASLLNESEVMKATNANNNTDFALLRFTHSIHYQSILQIKTDMTGSLKLTAKGCLAITLSISSPPLFPLTASSSIFQPAVKSAVSFPPFKGKACQRILVH